MVGEGISRCDSLCAALVPREGQEKALETAAVVLWVGGIVSAAVDNKVIMVRVRMFCINWFRRHLV